MNRLNIEPKRIKVFANCNDKHFCLVTNKELRNSIQVTNKDAFISSKIYFIENEHDFESLLENDIPDHSCVLVISPYIFFQSPPQSKLGNRRVIAMACNSTPTDMGDIIHFWNCLVETDPFEQQLKTDKFFDVGEKAKYLQFVDHANDTSANFMHLEDSYLWSEQTGILNDGEQQLAPSGEISVLPIDIQEFSVFFSFWLNLKTRQKYTPAITFKWCVYYANPRVKF